MTRFPRKELWLEGVRGVVARKVSSTLLALLSFAAALSVGLAGPADVRTVEQRWEGFRHAGGFAMEIRGSDIQASECERLNSIDGVRTAGGLVNVREVRSQALPAEPLFLLQVTPGYVPVMFPDEPIPAEAGVVAGAGLSSDLGIGGGSAMHWQDAGGQSSDLTVDYTVSTPARVRDWDDALVVVVTPAGELNSCLIEFEPWAFSRALHIMASHFHGADLTPSPMVDGTDHDPLGDLGARASRLLPLGFGFSLIAIAATLWWARRNEFAIYRVLGVQRHQLWRVFTAESLTYLILPIFVGITFASWSLAFDPSVASTTALLIDEVVLLATVGLAPLAGLAIVSSVRTVDALGGR